MNASPFLEAADRIGRRLCRDALWSGTECNWTGWSMEHIGQSWAPGYRSFGPELYSGTSGIALFLAHLLHLTPDPVLRRTLFGAINHATARSRALQESVRAGFYSGAAGLGYMQYEAGQLLKHDGLCSAGIETLVQLKDLQLNSWMLDVVSGCAGSIPPLIRVGHTSGTPALIDIAKRFGDHLLSSATKTDQGWAWDTMRIPNQKPLTGYSHGAAGIACALLELHSATGDARYHEAAVQAFLYERQHFVASQGNWQDLRLGDKASLPTQPACGMAWCHGAPGAGLARLRASELLGTQPELLSEAETAIQTTLSSLSHPVVPGFGNYSLCHGAAGNADCLITASQKLNRPDLFAAAAATGIHGIEVFAKSGLPWPCGVANAGETPNLLLGTAGIGYFYLRLHDPERVPSILLVEGCPKVDAGRGIQKEKTN